MAAAVLFVVTVPTEEEEEELKQEFINRKYDLKSVNADSVTIAGISLKGNVEAVGDNNNISKSRTPSTAVLVPTPNNNNTTSVTTTTTKSNGIERKAPLATSEDTNSITNKSINSEKVIGNNGGGATASNAENDTTAAATTTTPNQYGTFPKRRRKSEHVLKNLEGVLKNACIGGSLKSINTHTPVS